MNITKEQAKQITDIESYKKVTGAKRFKRTKEEVEAGLNAEDALKIRLGQKPSKTTTDNAKPKFKKGYGSQTLTIEITADSGVDKDLFERIPKGTISFRADDKTFAWLDNRLDAPYNGDIALMVSDIFDLGLQEIIVRKHLPKDIE